MTTFSDIFKSSFLENATAIGLPVPAKLKDVLAQLHGKDGESK